MSEGTGQSLTNHTVTPVQLIVAILLGLGAGILAIVSIFVDNPLILKVAVLDVAIAALLIGVTARQYATKLQDRIIRTEMKIRMRDVLDADLAKRAEADLTIGQLIALRFASDAELSALTTKALDDNLPKAEIKKQISDWQGDYYRV